MESPLFTNLDLLTLVAEFTDKRDNVNCLRVSRAFYRVFIKHVWAHVEFGNMSEFKGSPVKLFGEHQELVRELSLCSQHKIGRCPPGAFMCTAYGWLDGNPLRSLHRSAFNLLNSSASRIRSVAIRSGALERTWMSALLKCGALQKLELYGNIEMVISESDKGLFVQMCNRLHTLLLSSIRFPTWSHGDDEGVGDGISLPNIQHLAIGTIEAGKRSNTRIIGDIFIRNCDNLRSLRYCGRYDSYRVVPVKHYRTLQAGAACSESLHTIDFSSIRMPDDQLEFHIDNVKELRVLRARGAYFGQRSLNALLLYRKDNAAASASRDPDNTDLVRRTCDLLEVLAIERVTARSGWFSTIAANFPRLHELSAGTVRMHDMLSGGDWVFTNLVTLKLIINMGALKLNKKTTSHWGALTRRLSQLTRLEDLELRSRSLLDMTSAHLPQSEINWPFLEEFEPLQSLKLLKRFQLINIYDFTDNDKTEIVEFLDSWPKLQFIDLTFHPHTGTEWTNFMGEILALRNIEFMDL